MGDWERGPGSATAARLNDGVAADVMHEAMLAVEENQVKETILRETRAACDRLAHEEDRSKVLDDETRKVVERVQEMLARRTADRLSRLAEAEAPSSTFKDSFGERTMEFAIAASSNHDVLAAGEIGRADFANKLTEHTKADVSWGGPGLDKKRHRGADRDVGDEIFPLFVFRRRPEDRDCSSRVHETPPLS